MSRGRTNAHRSDAASRGTSTRSTDGTVDREDEAKLVAALQEGDRTAFHDAVTRFSPQMLATARAIVGAAYAEDIVQDAWITVHRQIGTFEQRAALGTWLNRIVSNRAISHLRAHAREVQMPTRDGEEPDSDWFDARGRWANPPRSWDAASPDDLLTAEALQDCIDKHLQLMPDSQRQVMVMRDMQGQSFDNICNDLELTASNARVLLHRARLRLMKMVDYFQETGTC